MAQTGGMVEAFGFFTPALCNQIISQQTLNPFSPTISGKEMVGWPLGQEAGSADQA